MNSKGNSKWVLRKFRINLLYIFIAQNFLLVSVLAYKFPIEDPCAIHDTCKELDYFRTCSCDNDCSRYGTCCSDAKMKDRYPKENFECHTALVSEPVFVKKHCHPAYEGDLDIQESCESRKTNWSDLMVNVLVSSNRTFVTYKNWNCAICNHESTDDLWFWTVQASYPTGKVKKKLNVKNFYEGFVYDVDLREWGVYDVDGKFIKCPIEFYQPPHLLGKLRYCAGNVTEDCVSYWEDKRVLQKCHSYYGERKSKHSKNYFKNAYCALCNGLDITDLECFSRNYRSVFPSVDILTMRVIFNLNPWTGEHLQHHLSCPDQYRYDPFLKICRSISCGIKDPTKKSCENSAFKQSNSFSVFNTVIFAFVFRLIVVS